MTNEPSGERSCWCGHPHLEAYSDAYHVCKACGTLVSRASLKIDLNELYDSTYWNERQTQHHGLPDIRERARLDLPERCTHWLRRLLSLRPPPARVLEIGCAHGGFVALLQWAGYKAIGIEMSPWVAEFARKTFGVEVLTGPVEQQPFAPGSFDVIVMNDVIEHLPDPLQTLRHCAGLLSPGGVFLVQTPEYKEHLTYPQLLETGDLFLKHMDRKNNEHLYLYSRRSSGLLFSRVGFPCVEFFNPIFPYDMFFAASTAPIAPAADAAVTSALALNPVGRLVQALLDKDFESTDGWWAIQRLESKLTPQPPKHP